MKNLRKLVGILALSSLFAGCAPRLMGPMMRAAVFTGAVVGTAAVVSAHRAHFHHHNCGCPRHWDGAHWVYYHEGGHEYWDAGSGVWVRY